MRSARAFAATLALAFLVPTTAASGGANPCASSSGSATATAEPSGLGGTGIVSDDPTTLIAGGDDDSGMGGTGVTGDEADGMGGTGIVGTVTGFGSICVNGLRVTYGAETPTELNGASARASDLALGDVVSVQATTDPETGELRATAIGVRHLVRGPLERADVQTGTLEVLGQTVVLPETWDVSTLATLEVGDSVAVSGQRRSDGRILASRLVLLETPDAASLIGTLELLENGEVRVAGTAIEAEVSIGADLPGEYVVVTGAWNSQMQTLGSAEVERAVAFDAELTSEISVGGYVEASDARGVLIGGVRLKAPRDRLEKLAVLGLNDYVLVRAVLSVDGSIRLVRIALDARPPRVTIPRPPGIQRFDRPDRTRRLRIQRPDVPPRPPRIDIPVKPRRVLRDISG